MQKSGMCKVETFRKVYEDERGACPDLCQMLMFAFNRPNDAVANKIRPTTWLEYQSCARIGLLEGVVCRTIVVLQDSGRMMNTGHSPRSYTCQSGRFVAQHGIARPQIGRVSRPASFRGKMHTSPDGKIQCDRFVGGRTRANMF